MKTFSFNSLLPVATKRQQGVQQSIRTLGFYEYYGEYTVINIVSTVFN